MHLFGPYERAAYFPRSLIKQNFNISEHIEFYDSWNWHAHTKFSTAVHEKTCSNVCTFVHTQLLYQSRARFVCHAWHTEENKIIVIVCVLSKKKEYFWVWVWNPRQFLFWKYTCVPGETPPSIFLLHIFPRFLHFPLSSKKLPVYGPEPVLLAALRLHQPKFYTHGIFYKATSN